MTHYVVDRFGTKVWYDNKHYNRHYHREDGPAQIFANGTEAWWSHGHLHRLDGPAYIGNDGSQEWWVNGLLHRTTGPARTSVYYGQGDWYINGYHITNQVEEWLKETHHSVPFDKPTEMLFLMKFG